MNQGWNSEQLARLVLGQLSQSEREAAVDQLLAQPSRRGEWRLAQALRPEVSTLAERLSPPVAGASRRAWWLALPATAAALMLLLDSQSPSQTPASQFQVAQAEVVYNGSFETDRELFRGRFEE